ncbi:MAG: hypoxanthine phosphoribosyltransferase [Verrucomicrobiales bacterium]|nr:hypoxanthine phosphoribosyltransferase [Verrucomicrobiales bacterium]
MASSPAPARSRTKAPTIPAAWKDHVDHILISEDQIRTRVSQLAAEISRDFSGHETVVLAVLNGTVLFLADLLRQLAFPMRLDFVGVSSYGKGTTSGDLVFTRPTSIDVRGRDVLIVDDILDTGKTLDRVTTLVRQFKPRRVRTCVLLDKKARRQIKIKGDYTGFQIPDEFVVGYGLDFAERYRNLPFIAVLKPEIYHPNDLPAPTSPPRRSAKA